MNFILLSDIHATSITPSARKDVILQTFIEKITYVFKLAKKKKAVILQAGDFFDKPRDWNLLLHLINLIKTLKPKIYTVYGQHDMYLRSDITNNATTLGILHQTGYLNLLTKKPTIIKGVHVYGASWGMSPPEPEGDHNILVIHAPIASAPLFPGHKYTSATRFTKKCSDYDLILVGDIHQYSYWNYDNVQMVNTGPMLRLDATLDNMEHEPRCFIYNSDNKEINILEIPHDESKVVLSRSHLESKKFVRSFVERFTDALEGMEVETSQMTIKEKLLRYFEDNEIEDDIQAIIEEAMVENGS